MTNIKYFLLLILGTAIFATSCSDFEEINMNVNEPEDAPLNVILPAAQEHLWGNYGSNNSARMTFNVYANTFTQHFAGNHATGVDYDQYFMNTGDEEFFFTRLYSKAFIDAKQIIDKAAEEKSPHYSGIAKIIQAVGLGYLTDIYGDIPWSEALQGKDFPYPSYDSQESIYTEIQRLLSDAANDLSAGESLSSPGSDDLVFGGDLSKWIGAAHMLSARYYNHLSKVDASGSASNALSALDDAYAAGFSSTASDMHYGFDGSAIHRNPWHRLWENNLIIASENFMNLLLNSSDPRLEAYWDNVAFGGTAVGYTGKCQGFGASNTSYSPCGPNGYFGKSDSPLLVATYFEAKFIEAEAAMRAGDAARAAAALNEAITANINKVVSDPDGLARAEAYLDANANETASSISMAKIMTHKYIAMFAQGIEGWTDVRRHDYAYPDYLEIPKESCTTPVATEFIRRILYPQSELNNNPDKVPTGVGIFDRLWWDK